MVDGTMAHPQHGCITTPHTLRSSLRLMTSFNNPIKMSVANVRSCASSRMMMEYRSSNGSVMASRRSIPSVMYLRMVDLLVQSSKRILYPTCDVHQSHDIHQTSTWRIEHFRYRYHHRLRVHTQTVHTRNYFLPNMNNCCLILIPTNFYILSEDKWTTRMGSRADRQSVEHNSLVLPRTHPSHQQHVVPHSWQLHVAAVYMPPAVQHVL